ncbi:MAG: hypothetical protein Q4C53_04305 [Clostridia bacterium]|nr:hypothetical protein [Clostridia bacterium]
MKPHRLFPACTVALTAVLGLTGCAYGTKSDVRSLQANIDTLSRQVYVLEQKVQKLEAAAATTPAPQRQNAATPVPAPGTASDRVYRMTADEICSALMKNGMPLISFTRCTTANDPDGLLGTNGGYKSRADFRDRDIADPEAMGTVEVYDSAEAAQLRMSALAFHRVQAPEFVPEEQAFVYDNVVLRLPGAFTAEQGMRYEDALRKVLGLLG